MKGYSINAAKIFVEELIGSLEMHLQRKPTDSEVVAYILGDNDSRLAILDKPICADHNPVQHRDGKPPWCRDCGLTADFENPTARRDR